MKKILLILSLLLLCQSCIYLHRAKRIDGYEMMSITSIQDLAAYAFEYDEGEATYRKSVRSFFKLADDDRIREFTTDKLVPNTELTVYVSRGFDHDNYINLLGIFCKDDDDRHRRETQLQRQQRELREQKRKEQLNEVGYIYVQMMNDKGEDVLAKHSLTRDIIIQKLNRFRQQLSY